MPSTVANGTSPHVLSQRSIDDIRPLKVLVVGAGVSGILAGIRFPQYVEELDLVIYDKNEDIGGTWFENKYPGIACGQYAQARIHSGQHRLIASRYSRTFLPAFLRIQPIMVQILRRRSRDPRLLEANRGEV